MFDPFGMDVLTSFIQIVISCPSRPFVKLVIDVGVVLVVLISEFKLTSIVVRLDASIGTFSPGDPSQLVILLKLSGEGDADKYPKVVPAIVVQPV